MMLNKKHCKKIYTILENFKNKKIEEVVEIARKFGFKYIIKDPSCINRTYPLSKKILYYPELFNYVKEKNIPGFTILGETFPRTSGLKKRKSGMTKVEEDQWKLKWQVFFDRHYFKFHDGEIRKINFYSETARNISIVHITAKNASHAYKWKSLNIISGENNLENLENNSDILSFNEGDSMMQTPNANINVETKFENDSSSNEFDCICSTMENNIMPTKDDHNIGDNTDFDEFLNLYDNDNNADEVDSLIFQNDDKNGLADFEFNNSSIEFNSTDMVKSPSLNFLE